MIVEINAKSSGSATPGLAGWWIWFTLISAKVPIGADLWYPLPCWRFSDHGHEIINPMAPLQARRT